MNHRRGLTQITPAGTYFSRSTLIQDHSRAYTLWVLRPPFEMNRHSRMLLGFEAYHGRVVDSKTKIRMAVSIEVGRGQALGVAGYVDATAVRPNRLKNCATPFFPASQEKREPTGHASRFPLRREEVLRENNIDLTVAIEVPDNHPE